MTHDQIRKEAKVGVVKNPQDNTFAICDILMEELERVQDKHDDDRIDLCQKLEDEIPERTKRHPKLADWLDCNIDTEANVFVTEDEAWKAIKDLL